MSFIFVSHKTAFLYFIESYSAFCHICCNIFLKQLNNNIANEIYKSALKLRKTTSFQHTGTNNTKKITAYSFERKAIACFFVSTLFLVQAYTTKQHLQEKLFQKSAMLLLPKDFVMIKHSAKQKSCKTNNYCKCAGKNQNTRA